MINPIFCICLAVVFGIVIALSQKDSLSVKMTLYILFVITTITVFFILVVELELLPKGEYDGVDPWSVVNPFDFLLFAFIVPILSWFVIPLVVIVYIEMIVILKYNKYKIENIKYFKGITLWTIFNLAYIYFTVLGPFIKRWIEQ